MFLFIVFLKVLMHFFAFIVKCALQINMQINKLDVDPTVVHLHFTAPHK